MPKGIKANVLRTTLDRFDCSSRRVSIDLPGPLPYKPVVGRRDVLAAAMLFFYSYLGSPPKNIAVTHNTSIVYGSSINSYSVCDLILPSIVLTVRRFRGAPLS